MEDVKIYTKIDWFTIMFRDTSFNTILKWLQLDPEVYVSDFLKNQYERLSGFDQMFIFSYEGVTLETRQLSFFGEEMNEDIFDKIISTIRVDISGHGLDFLRSLGINVDIFLRTLDGVPQPSHVTRCDFAFDLINYKPEFLDELIEYAQTNHTDANRICLYKSNNGLKYRIGLGDKKIIYFGATTSDKMLRVYDKRMQYIDSRTKLYIKDNPYNNPDSWIRIEFQTRNKYAHWLSYEDCDMLQVFRYLYETYCFADVANTTTQNRKPAKFWTELFDWETIPSIIQNFHFV